MRVQTVVRAACAVFVLLTTACGESDGDGSPVPFPPLVITTTVLPTATQAQPYNTNIAATGGTDTGYTWSIIVGTLPAGIALGVAGTPGTTLSGATTVSGTFNFTIVVRDSLNHAASMPLQLDVSSAPPLNITTATLPAADQGQAYNAAITATGGSGAGFSWSISAGPLPGGLSLATSGTPSTAITGVPVVAGTFNFTVRVTDSISFVDTVALQLVINPAPTLTITTASVPSGQQGQAYSTPVAATGGTGAGYTWSVIAGALPNGVSLSGTGTPSTTLAGLPTAAGTFNFTVQVQDSIGLSATVPLQLVLAPAPTLTVTTASLPAATQGTAYSTAIAATGGSGAGYTWSVVAGALPAGVTLSQPGTPSTTLAGTPTANGTFNFTVRVQDSIGLVATAPLQLVVSLAVALVITPPAVPNAVLTQAYNQLISASGGSGAGYQWSVTQGSLPLGMALAATGTPSTTLTGTPTEIGGYKFTVQVTDSQVHQATLEITLVVASGAPADSWSLPFIGPHDRAGTAVFTGSRIIQWGGTEVAGGFFTSNVSNEGEVFGPHSVAPVSTSLVGAPSARMSHTAVWTGTRMIIHGGYDMAFNLPGDTRAYDPVTNTWATLSNVNAPTPRTVHTAVWTGTEMIIWGGENAQNITQVNGAAYNPATNGWRTLAPAPAAVASRGGHKAAWTGTHMIVLGGYSNPGPGPTIELRDGAMYDPATDTWPATIAGASAPPVIAADSTVIWTGSRLLVWGYDDTVTQHVGGLWNPATGAWTPMAQANQPLGRRSHSSVWTGTKLLVWGGLDAGFTFATDDGGIYDAAANQWGPMNNTGAPSGRFGHHAFWTGREMITWGGRDMGFAGSNPQDEGAVYTP